MLRHRTTTRWPLRIRVTVAFAVLALGLSTSLAVFSYELTRTYLLSKREDATRQQAFVNARSVRDALAATPDDVQTALEQVQTSTDSAAVLHINAQWYGTSVGVGHEEVPRSLRAMVARGEAGDQHVLLHDVPQAVVGVPLVTVHAEYFELVPLNELNATLGILARALLAASVVATAIAATIGWYASARVLRPVRRMSLAAGQIGQGAYDQRLDADGDSDLEPLVVTFNEMVESMQERIELESRFASNVSHELRTPLASIAASFNVARRRVPSGPADAALDTLETEIQEFIRLVLDLMEISRMGAGVAALDLSTFSPADLVATASAASNPSGVDVVAPAITIDESTPASITADRRRLEQVLVNLLDNAAAYAGGVTHIGVTAVQGEVVFTLDDAGPGVPETERTQIFERFSRGETSSSPGAPTGSGLGLSLAAEHVRLHGGRIWVEDSPAAGARFVVCVPQSPTQQLDGEHDGS